MADRWHLLTNLWETLEAFFVARKPIVQTAFAVPRPQNIEALPWLTGRMYQSKATSQERHQRFADLYHQVQDLAAKRVDVAAIAERLGVGRGTVYRSRRMRQPPERTRCPVIIRSAGEPDAMSKYPLKRPRARDAAFTRCKKGSVTLARYTSHVAVRPGLPVAVITYQVIDICAVRLGQRRAFDD